MGMMRMMDLLGVAGDLGIMSSSLWIRLPLLLRLLPLRLVMLLKTDLHLLGVDADLGIILSSWCIQRLLQLLTIVDEEALGGNRGLTPPRKLLPPPPLRLEGGDIPINAVVEVCREML